jgi:hypothetical protein
MEHGEQEYWEYSMIRGQIGEKREIDDILQVL